MDSNIRKYFAYVCVVDCGSFTQAAELLHYSQSAVSRMIGDLEQEWGITLLERGRSGVRVTSEEQRILPYVEELCREYEKLQMQVDEINGLQSGLIRIGTFSSAATHWLPNMIRKFRQQYPNIQYEILLGDYGEIEQWVLEGRVDCGFLRLPSVKRLQTYALHRDELQVIVPCDHPYAHTSPFPAEALAEEPFIQLEEGEDYEIRAAFDEMGVRPNVKYTAREDRTILAMVSKGLGISLLPELMVRHSPYPVTACRPPMTFYRNIGIAVKDEKALSASTRRFVEYVRGWVAENGGK